MSRRWNFSARYAANREKVRHLQRPIVDHQTPVQGHRPPRRSPGVTVLTCEHYLHYCRGLEAPASWVVYRKAPDNQPLYRLLPRHSRTGALIIGVCFRPAAGRILNEPSKFRRASNEPRGSAEQRYAHEQPSKACAVRGFQFSLRQLARSPDRAL